MQRRATSRGKATLAAIEEAARVVIARKGYLNMTVADIAQEAGKSQATFYNYYDSKEHLLRHWAEEFQGEALRRAEPAFERGLDARERVRRSAQAQWDTYRERLAEMVGVFQLAMINADFAKHWNELCETAIDDISRTILRAQSMGYCPGIDPRLTASAIVAMLNQFCYDKLAGSELRKDPVDDKLAVDTLAEIWYRAIYWKE